MQVVAGDRIGPYEIVGSLGAGGMGEVYRARDTRLDRDVAITMVSGLAAGDTDVRQRFEREARTISQLMARSSATYQPRAPAARVLYQVVREHFRTFRAEAAGVCDGRGLPRFVEAEFEGFLRCGFLAGGFARFQCEGCHQDLLVPSSCKGRAICPSCGGRRMAERAAHLVDHVLPIVPVRQWVLTLPHLGAADLIERGRVLDNFYAATRYANATPRARLDAGSRALCRGS